MDTTILLGYAGGIITMAGLAMYPENFKPSITENPRAYVITGTAIAICSFLFDLCEWCI